MFRRGVGGGGVPLDRQPQPGVQLGRAGGVEHDVVDHPLGRQRDQPALGEHGDHRHGDAHGREHSGERAGAGQLAPGVDQDDVAQAAVDERRSIESEHGYVVGQQAQCGQYLGRGLRCSGEQHELHGRLPDRERWSPGVAALPDPAGGAALS